MKAKKGFTLIELLIVIAIIAILALIAVPNFLEAQTRAKVSRVHADLRTVATGLETYYLDHNAYPPVCSLWFYNQRLQDNDCIGTVYSWYLNYETDSPNMALRINTSLTTPIAYLTGKPPTDPFGIDKNDVFNAMDYRNVGYVYSNFLLAAQDRARLTTAECPLFNLSEYLIAPTPVEFQGSDRVNNSMWLLHSIGPSRQTEHTFRRNNGTEVSQYVFNLAGNPRYRYLLGWPPAEEGLRYPQYDPTNGTVSGGQIWRTSSGSL